MIISVKIKCVCVTVFVDKVYHYHDASFRLLWNFLPDVSFGLRVLSLRPYICVCVNHVFVHAITWNIVNWTLRNKIQWNSNQNKLFIHENAIANVVWEMAALLFRGRWVTNSHKCLDYYILVRPCPTGGRLSPWLIKCGAELGMVLTSLMSQVPLIIST